MLGGGFFNRAFKGAAAGGVVGGMNSDWGWQGMAGGAAAGAAFGAFGAPKVGGINYAGGMRRGLQAARRGTVGLERAGRSIPLAIGANRARGALGTARTAIGQNAVSVNKYGGRAAAALGVGSAALMGSSLVNSNRGY